VDLSNDPRESTGIFALGTFTPDRPCDSPVILTEPISRTNNANTDAIFTVAAQGTPPFTYQWSKDGVGIPGGTDSTLVLPNVQKLDQGSYSVLVSNACGATHSSSAFLYVNRLPVADASATQLLVISSNGTSASVILDGTRSTDPDGDSLQYVWYESGNANPLANGVLAMASLPVGTHALVLVVSDGIAAATNAVTVEVITTAQAVAQLADAVTAAVSRVQPFLATLSAAEASLNRGNVVAAINQLNAFQNKVRAQLGRNGPTTSAVLIQAAQEIIEVLMGVTGP